MSPTFTICILFYGSYLKLAERCLESILKLPAAAYATIRVGFNACTSNIVDYVEKRLVESAVPHLSFHSQTNIGKYPMMRRMFHDASQPITTTHVIWFDDDSYLKNPSEAWVTSLKEVAARPSVSMFGKVFSGIFGGNQHLWIEQQPWYKGKPIQQGWPSAGKYYTKSFVVGGWWCIKMDVLREIDWPPPNIIHRGGDMMLGEALRQNNYTVTTWYADVAVNADAAGNNDKAKRRGWNPLPVGIDYSPPLTTVLFEANKNLDPALDIYEL